MTSSYATVTDVETRLGFTFDSGEAQSVTMFLQDLSLVIDSEITKAGKQPSDFNPDFLKMFVSRKGVEYYLYNSREGATSISESVGDTSRSASYQSGENKNEIQLSAKDKTFLGISGNAGFVNWQLVKHKGN